MIGLGLVLLLTFCGLTWFILSKFKQLKNRLSESDDAMRQTLEKLAQLDDELHEIRSGNQALGKKVKELIVSINGLDDKQQKLAEHDPQSRFYQKAAKLIAGGATLNDVMQECDLPRAEAELLFSLHQR
ncbi:hypothetical protein AX660_20830 [Paraglaciecola hydrolytica]|uniref:DNA repair protein n=1 Tax=Paraglaciecola hydrolytica TaxID=1799789 RepID=A0A148KNZ8_9ALTE|nr:hypothetical protein AX660_20830 [Paraglaciecola hydrolytica]